MTRGSLLVLLPALLVGAAGAAPPVIVKVHPEYPMVGMHKQHEEAAPGSVIVGEGFDLGELEIWNWSPPKTEADVARSVPKLGVEEIALPATPPEGAEKVTILDVEPQVAVAVLSGGAVLWARNRDGWSAPFRYCTARPFWLSRPTAYPRDLLYIYGYGLRRYWYNGDEQGYVVLKSPARALGPLPIDNRGTPLLNNLPRAQRVLDTRLAYWQVPADAAPGAYTVWYNSGRGGEYGWAKAGELEILPGPPPEEKFLNVRDYGAKGDGLASDEAAINAAMAAAVAAGGGVVFFPPGVYPAAALAVPSGVTLRGASRETSILCGTGTSNESWRRNLLRVDLSARSGLEHLYLQGGTVGIGPDRGSGSMTLHPAEPPTEYVTIAGCRINPWAEDPVTRVPRTQNTGLTNLIDGRNTRYLRINGNLLENGTVYVFFADHLEMIGNTFRGIATDMCSFQMRTSNALIDSNTFVEGAGRIVLYPSDQTYLRLNRCEQQVGGAPWHGGPEMYLMHPWEQALHLGRPTAATATTLTQAGANWTPDQHRRRWVVIVDGKGFGQYRRVVGNTADTLTVETPWLIPPDATSTYIMDFMHVENAFYANLNSSSSYDTFQQGALNCVVEGHRAENTMGLWVHSYDYSQRGPQGEATKFWGPNSIMPMLDVSYYTSVYNCWLDQTYLKLMVEAKAEQNYYWGVPAQFATLLSGNAIVAPHQHRQAPPGASEDTAGIDLGYAGRNTPTASHTIVTGNRLKDAPVGILVRSTFRKTFLRGNFFQSVEVPIADAGARTILEGNRLRPSHELIPDGDNRREFTVPEWVTAVRAQYLRDLPPPAPAPE